MQLIHIPVSRCVSPPPAPTVFTKGNISSSSIKINKTRATGGSGCCSLLIATFFAALTVVTSAAGAIDAPQQDAPTLSNVPQTLSSDCNSESSPPNKDCKKVRIQRPKSRKAESCTIKCVTTCIRGGEGSPGEGPLNMRRPLVVFKPGFRSRQYCLVECSDICNLIPDGDDGP